MEHIQNGYLIEGYQEGQNLVNEHWLKLIQAKQNKMILQAELIGLQEIPNPKKNEEPLYKAILDYNGFTGYISLEEMSIKPMPVQKLRNRVGTKVRFVVKDCHEDEDNGFFFVASRKEAEKIAADTTLNVRKVGEIIKATVVAVGAKFITVDVGGIETIISIGETDYGWIDNLNRKFRIGELIDVKILAIDKDKRTVTVSRKATMLSPWALAEKRYKVNSEHIGFVSGIVEKGVYIQLSNGVDAFAKHLRHEAVQVGDKVLIRVVKVDAPREHIYSHIVRLIRT